MEDYIIDILPFNQKNKRDVLHEFHMVVKSMLSGTFISHHSRELPCWGIIFSVHLK